MRLISFVVGCALLVGCNNATKDFEKLADRACACAEDDTACGTKVLTDLVTFAEHNKTSDGDPSRMTQAGIKLNGCLAATGVQQTALTATLEKLVK